MASSQGTEPGARATLGCLVAISDGGTAIGDVLDSLLVQTRRPDDIHVVVNTPDSEAPRIAGGYAGIHLRSSPSDTETTHLYVHDIGDRPGNRTDALDYGFAFVEGLDYLLDVDTVVDDPLVLESLLDRISADTGLGALRTAGPATERPGRLSGLLLPPHRRRDITDQPRGRVTIFSIDALRRIADKSGRTGPWGGEDEKADARLIWQLSRAGYRVATSAGPR